MFIEKKSTPHTTPNGVEQRGICIFLPTYTALGHKLRFRHCELAKQSRLNKQFTGLLRATPSQ
jgi:hypothetical protein